MKKRLISGLTALVLALSLVPAALAAENTQEEAAQVLAALDIMVGDENGDLALGRSVTRAEFTKMVIAASPQRESAGSSASVAPYPDVPRTHWAAAYVQAAVEAGYVSGYLDGTFRPDNTITLAEGVTMILPLLGYEKSDFTGAYPAGQMAAYRNLGLNENISAGQDSPMTRQDALYLFYNLMTTKNTSGVYYLNTLEPTLNLVDSQGNLDRVALVNSAMEGPLVAEGSWQSQLPLDLTRAEVYRDGRASSLSAVQNLDVLYWSESMNTLWAYSKQVTGTLEQVSPSVSAPTAVTVAGSSYALETNEAVYAFSDLGGYRTGDLVTLLLGRSGGVAAVRGVSSGEEGSSNLVYGMVIQASTHTYTDERGNEYTSNAVTLTTTTGATATYPTEDTHFEAGDLVRVTTENGAVQIRRLSTTQLEGTFSRDGSRLGRYTLADNVAILDTYEDSAAWRVYPSRLAGVKLTGNMVRFYSTNEQGEIDHLILRDVTGDGHTYGVLTSVDEISAGMTSMATYVVDVGGTESTIVSSSKIYNVDRGPCQIQGALQAPDRITNLMEVRLDAVSGNTAVSSANQSWRISESAAVYEVRDGEYYLTSLARVTGGDHTLTGYYDTAQDQGGCIRVILARS